MTDDLERQDGAEPDELRTNDPGELPLTREQLAEILKRQTPEGFDENEPYTVELVHPVTLGSGEGARVVEVLVLQPLTGEHVWMLSADLSTARFGDFLKVAALMAGEPVAVVKRLHARDLNRVLQVVSAFFSMVQGIG